MYRNIGRFSRNGDLQKFAPSSPGSRAAAILEARRAAAMLEVAECLSSNYFLHRKVQIAPKLNDIP